MNPYDFVHLTFHAVGGQISGRTRLQKLAYFLGVLTEAENELGFRPHYYGPYSDSVTEALNRLKALGFVSESAFSSDQKNSAGFETTGYQFCLTSDGTRIAHRKAEDNPAVWQTIKLAAERISSAGDIDYVRMSVAAKSYFVVRRKGKNPTSIELGDSARCVGWKINAEDVQHAVEYLEKLELVTPECSKRNEVKASRGVGHSRHRSGPSGSSLSSARAVRQEG